MWHKGFELASICNAACRQGGGGDFAADFKKKKQAKKQQTVKKTVGISSSISFRMFLHWTISINK